MVRTAAEYSANALQTLQPSGAVIFTNSPVQSENRLIFHRDESGVFRLASPSKIVNAYGGGWLYANRCCCCRRMPEALYQVSFSGNIGLPTGGTVGELSLGIAIDSVIDPSSTMISTPSAVETLDNVSTGIIVAVPAICGCESVSVVNSSDQQIVVQNANLLIEFIGIRS